MGFLGVYKAIYDYTPQSDGELQISEGDLLYVLEKSAEDDWWKAKKKAGEDDEEESVGLIPNNYIEEAAPSGHARALFEYARQTDEELSFPEDADLQVFDSSDPDWILVGLKGDYGFVPANYIELQGGAGHSVSAPEPEEEDEAPPPSLPTRPSAAAEEDVPSPPLPVRNVPAEPSSPAASGPAAALAGVLAGRSAPRAPPPVAIPPRPQYTADGYEEDEPRSPPLPTRPRPQSMMSGGSPVQSPAPSAARPTFNDMIHEAPEERPSYLSPGGFHMYNISEMISVMGKRKKMPTTLGVNLKTGMILIAPERAQDGPSQEWSADKMTHYSREGKHVFMELVRPTKSVDFHAGAKDTAGEIVSYLGELAGAIRAEGLKEVIMAGTGRVQQKGVMLYDFMAQGEDEITVAVGDEVIVLDSAKSEEWWQVRRLKNGKEGVVPSSYIEITGPVDPPASQASTSGVNAGRSTVEQNRLEEARLTKEAVKAAMRDSRSTEPKTRRENGKAEGSSSKSGKSKPDPSKVRLWSDRSKSFSVEAQFLGLKDGKFNLHKMNGVKIAVPVAKMSVEDLEYVEELLGISLDEDKPLSDVRRQNKARRERDSRAASGGTVGATIEKKPEYDWFQFFLSCDVAVGLCERYTQAMARDSMDESVMPDIDAGVLRTLGLREGDIIKVMRFLDNKYGRTRKKEEAEAEGGLFSGPGGTLRNNTRRGRPSPSGQPSDVVDPKALSKDGETADGRKSSPAPPVVGNATSGDKATGGGFDDDAWNVKPSKQPPPEQAPRPAEPTPPPAPAAASAPKQTPALTGSMQELSLLTQPLEPTKTGVSSPPAQPVTAPAQQPTPAGVQSPPAQQPLGATPSFFTALAQQQTGMQGPAMNGPQAFARQRPLAPQYTQGQPGLMPPPPARAASAPQSAQPSAFAPPPLQPQMTGQVAPPGQSLNEITQQRLQQQYAQQMQQVQQQQQQMQQQMPMGFQPQHTGQPMMGYLTGMQPQPTGFGAPPNQYGMMNGMQPQQQLFSPMQAQPTGFPGPFQPQQQPQPQQFPQPTGVNSFLPAALEPQHTGLPQPLQPLQPLPTGHFARGFGNAGMAPSAPPQPPAQPLVPQQTGPPPPVRFGVTEPKKMAPQPTGRRANLAQATPHNPFGF